MSTPNVGFTREEVSAMLPRWDLIRDCLSGEPTIKAKRTDYLPMPNPKDTSPDNLARYESYLTRADFYNVAQRTHTALTGQCFQKDPLLELPGLLSILEPNVDGAGVTLLQQAKKGLGYVLGYGRAGLLTDFPDIPEGTSTSKADMDNGVVRPTVILYEPWRLINWRTTSIGAKQVLSLVVIAETTSLSDDGFELKVEPRWRVLSLDENGLYRVGVWKLTTEQPKGVWVEEKFSYPKDGKGNSMKEIPFTFIGSINNDPQVDLPPIYDLCSMNLSHYRTAADHNWSVFMCGQVQPVMTGLPQAWVDQNFKGGVTMGSTKTISLPVGADFKMVQANPQTLTGDTLERKERQMVALGARLVEQRTVQRTLGEKRLEFATEISVLESCAHNVADAYVQAFKWAGMFIDGQPTEPVFELYPEFELEKMTPDEIRTVQGLQQARLITWGEARTKLKQGGYASEDDDEAKETIDAEKPAGGTGVIGANGFPAKQPPVTATGDNGGQQ